MIQSSESSISEMPPEILKVIKKAFNILDTNGTGTINPKELKPALESLGENNSNSTVYQLISLLERSEETQEKVTFEEFVKAIYEKLGDSKSNTGIKRLFEMFKKSSGSNAITLSDLKNISQQLGENISDEDLKEMMNRISKGQGQLSFEQFNKIINEK